MKKKLAIILAAYIFISNICFCVPVKATNYFDLYKQTVESVLDDIKTDTDNNIETFQSVVKTLWRGVGYIVNPNSFGRDVGKILKYIRDQGYFGLNSNSSDQDTINAYLRNAKNNVSIGDNNIIINDSFKGINKSIINQNSSISGGKYVYSFNISDNMNRFSDGNEYNALRRLLLANSNKDALLYRGANPSHVFMGNLKYPMVAYMTTNYEIVKGKIYNKTSWEEIQLKNVFTEHYVYNTSTQTYDLTNDSSVHLGDYDLGCYSNILNNTANSLGSSLLWNVSVAGYKTYYMFNTLTDLQNSSQGLSNYYKNQGIFDSFNNSSGDYTVDNSNCNNVTYGDITNYIDNNPDANQTDIQIYIDNNIPEPNPTPTPSPTPDNPSGGGTVSGNTNNGGSASASATANNSGVNVTVNNNHNINFNVPGLSGNGIGSGTVSGNGNGSGGIFDWISDIGGVIGDFIKNVGQLIADVIKGITETITTVLADIPNIISVLVEFVYGGLPDELKAIVTLGITTVIFVGVIKMMRK